MFLDFIRPKIWISTCPDVRKIEVIKPGLQTSNVAKTYMCPNVQAVTGPRCLNIYQTLVSRKLNNLTERKFQDFGRQPEPNLRLVSKVRAHLCGWKSVSLTLVCLMYCYNVTKRLVKSSLVFHQWALFAIRLTFFKKQSL